MYQYLLLISPGDERPDWRDLNIHVIPQYAAHWKALGAILGLKYYEIDSIHKDNPSQ